MVMKMKTRKWEVKKVTVCTKSLHWGDFFEDVFFAFSLSLILGEMLKMTARVPSLSPYTQVGYLGFISTILYSLMDWSTRCFHTQGSSGG